MKKLFIILVLTLVTFAASASSSHAITTTPFKPTLPFAFFRMTVLPFLIEPWHKLQIEFINTRGVKTVSYLLTYTQNGVEEGVKDGFSVPLNSTASFITKIIPLETCSANDCVFHSRIHHMVLTVDTTYTSGLHTHKVYNIKK